MQGDAPEEPLNTGPEPGGNNIETHQHRIIIFILMPR